VNLNFIENLVRMSGASKFSEGQVQLWEQLKPWLSKIAQNGALKWLPQASMHLGCQIPHYDRGQPVGSCERIAVDTCIGCGKPSCLEHSFVDSNGDLICYLCVARIASPKHQQQNQTPPPSKKEEAEKKAWWARGVLGIDANATLDQVRKAHRTLSGRWHPDKSDGDEKRYKDVQVAFDLLKTMYGEN